MHEQGTLSRLCDRAFEERGIQSFPLVVPIWSTCKQTTGYVLPIKATADDEGLEAWSAMLSVRSPKPTPGDR